MQSGHLITRTVLVSSELDSMQSFCGQRRDWRRAAALVHAVPSLWDGYLSGSTMTPRWPLFRMAT